VLIENGKIEEVGSPPDVQAHAGGVFAWVPVRTAEFLLLDGLGESAHV
jgi:hypothetical protein